MFDINHYLQYKNTPDNKTRVLEEGIDYNCKTVESLHRYIDSERNDYDVTLFNDEIRSVLEHCRPLLTFNNVRGLSLFIQPTHCQLLYFNGATWVKYEYIDNQDSLSITDTHAYQNAELVYFESDPEKYSQLLWGCSETEGWKKIFKLLDIDKSYD